AVGWQEGLQELVGAIKENVGSDYKTPMQDYGQGYKNSLIESVAIELLVTSFLSIYLLYVRDISKWEKHGGGNYNMQRSHDNMTTCLYH
ncbi:hypothetical protein ACJX0J_018680, partial [Zea mays]